MRNIASFVIEMLGMFLFALPSVLVGFVTLMITGEWALLFLAIGLVNLMFWAFTVIFCKVSYDDIINLNHPRCPHCDNVLFDVHSYNVMGFDRQGRYIIKCNACWEIITGAVPPPSLRRLEERTQ